MFSIIQQNCQIQLSFKKCCVDLHLRHNPDMPNLLTNTLYYLPGYGGQLATGLGRALMDRGFDVTGRETRGDFRRLPFDEQIATVGQDLKDHFWHEEARVICNSFGAYLFLHAQTQLPSFPGRVLLLSPIVGEFTNVQARTSFSPPRPTRLKDLAEAGDLTVPRECEMHVGEEDWQSIPANVQALGRLTRIPVNVVAGGGHDLGKDYVGPLLDRWLVS
jgi:hypothetical protein